MTKKGKRVSSGAGGAETSRRRHGASAAVDGSKAAETLRECRVVCSPILPPTRRDGKKVLELELVSKRIYQETILRCEVG